MSGSAIGMGPQETHDMELALQRSHETLHADLAIRQMNHRVSVREFEIHQMYGGDIYTIPSAATSRYDAIRSSVVCARHAAFAKKEMALVQSAPMNQSLAQFKESYNFAHICEEFEVQRDIDFVYDKFHSHAGLYPFLDIPAMWGYCIIHF
jgi:hypothetical protein